MEVGNLLFLLTTPLPKVTLQKHGTDISSSSYDVPGYYYNMQMMTMGMQNTTWSTMYLPQNPYANYGRSRVQVFSIHSGSSRPKLPSVRMPNVLDIDIAVGLALLQFYGIELAPHLLLTFGLMFARNLSPTSDIMARRMVSPRDSEIFTTALARLKRYCLKVSRTGPYSEPMLKSRSLTTFHKFPGLPRDLQNRVWQLAARKPKVFTLMAPWDKGDPKSDHFELIQCRSGLETACRASRHFAVQPQARRQLSLKHKIKYFVPAVDTIRIDVFRFALDGELNTTLRNISKLGIESLGLLCGHTETRTPNFLRLTSDQVGIPAELTHINKRRKRNQQGLPSLLKFPMNPLSSAVTLVGLRRK
jgi:hypothetical protein